jgi:hypothetical protein
MGYLGGDLNSHGIIIDKLAKNKIDVINKKKKRFLKILMEKRLDGSII